MSIGALIIFVGVACIDFIVLRKKMTKKEIGLYFVIFTIFLLLYGLAFLGKISPHFAQILKPW